MNAHNHVGIHLPFRHGLRYLVDQAIDLQLPYFQFFLTHENRYVHITNDDLRYFLSFRNQFSSLFIHSSYWINPATGIQENLAISKRLILKEINYAQRLEVPFIVLHAGNAKGYLGTTAKIARQQGIDTIARFFNALLKTNPPVTFLFENTAHEGNAVGSNLEDFGLLKTKIDYPEKIGFCLDTAHAFSYGYELTQPSAFIEYINKTIGLDSLKLMHLNDSSISIGRKHDQHALPGQGKIGLHILRALATHPLLAHLSKIIEYPALIRSKSDTIAQLTDWNNYIIQIASKNAQF